MSVIMQRHVTPLGGWTCTSLVVWLVRPSLQSVTVTARRGFVSTVPPPSPVHTIPRSWWCLARAASRRLFRAG